MSRVTLLALLASLSLVTGCSDDPISSRPNGSYTAAVTGAFGRSLRGEARLVAGHSGYGRPTLSLFLGGESAEDRVSLVIAADELPDVGDYEIATFSSEPIEGRWIGVYLISAEGQPEGYFTALDGLVRITHSSSGRLKGVFALDAEGYPGGPETEPVSIVIEGTFDAGLASR